MSTTSETRIESYNAIQGDAANRRELIFDTLSGAPDGMTAEEIADTLLRVGKIRRFDMNYVRPRLTELKKAGRVETIGKRRSYRTGKKTAVWARRVNT